MSGPLPVPDYSGDFSSDIQRLNFTQVPDDILQKVASDSRWPKPIRVLSWIILHSWRYGSYYAIDPTGAPLFQRDLSKSLSIDKRALSKIVAQLVKRGYLIDHPKLLYPSISSQNPGSSQKVADASNFFLEFVENWKVAHASDFQELEVARATVERIRKVIVSEYRKSLAEEKKRKIVAIRSEKSLQQATHCTVHTSIEEVGRYMQEPETGLSACVPTDSNSEPEHKPLSVEERILELPAVKAVERQLKDTLRQPLLGKIAAKLNGAPPDRLNERIHLRFAKIKSFGVLVNFAQDVREIWEAEQATRESEQQEHRRREVDALRAIAADLEEPEDVRADARRRWELLE